PRANAAHLSERPATAQVSSRVSCSLRANRWQYLSNAAANLPRTGNAGPDAGGTASCKVLENPGGKESVLWSGAVMDKQGAGVDSWVGHQAISTDLRPRFSVFGSRRGT